MDLKEEIQNALKTNTVIIGYRRSVKYLKMQKPKAVVVASNAPESLKKEIGHNAKISGISVETFSGSSVELGVFCGRPFPIAVLTIK